MTDLPTYPLSEEGVTQALADLDKGGSEDIAHRFAELGIKGQVGHECACPVHAYLTRVLPDADSVNVGGTEVFVWGWLRDEFGFSYDVRFHTSLPDSVSAFIEDFDQAIYPELIEEAAA
jgi:hypothetical protein